MEAQSLLVERLTPEIHYNVAKMLRRWRTGSAAGRDLRQEVEDLVQEAFVELWQNDARVLRRWNPERLPLSAYIGYVARIRTAQVLRSPRSQWREEPDSGDDGDRVDPKEAPDCGILARDELEKILLCLFASFTADDFYLFELLFVRELSPKEAAEETGKSRDAVYKWRSRLYERARRCLEQLSKKSD